MKSPVKKQHPHPDEMGNGEFQSSGGLISYQLLYDLIGRVGRLEGGFAIVVMMLVAILGLLATIVTLLVKME